jgi:hypothetical protein
MASLIPLLNSAKYRDKGQYFYEKHKIHFLNILKSESYYLLRELPRHILEPLFMPHVPELLKKQRANGMWKRSDGERITYDILAALRKCDPELLSETRLPNSPYEQVKDKTDLYSVLIKRLLPGSICHADKARGIIDAYYAEQEDTGAWHATVVGTVATLDALLLLGADENSAEMRAGIRYLLEHLNPTQNGLHIEEPYGYTAHYMFSTQDRNKEFAMALRLKPEWIPQTFALGTWG